MQQSFIVRVYRHDKDNPRMLVGTVEKVGEQGKAAFATVDELWEIMNGVPDQAMRVKGKEKTNEMLSAEDQRLEIRNELKGGGV